TVKPRDFCLDSNIGNNNLLDIPVNIAITGESGSGKSTLVNALRGIKNGTEGAAKTGAMETTMEPTEYIHPKNNNIRIWDLPGIGTVNVTADKYLEYVGFEKYDFFIIVSRDRFTENDAKLAKEIQKMKKKFYFVRSRIDESIQGEKEDNPNLNEENLLNQIRENCREGLKKVGLESPMVFLVSGKKLQLYDFNKLWETLNEDLPELQRDVLLLALPNISLDVIEQKEKALRSKLKWYALGSAAGAAVPVPALSETVDLGMIIKFAEQCQNSLGLNVESLKMLSDVSGVSLEDLKAELKSPLAAAEINRGLVVRVLINSAAYIIGIVIEEGARYVPFIGIPFAMTLSSITTYKALAYILNTLAEDAQRVFKKALRINTPV
uniref:IRG-type G domain-containing protein n=1 Tax=Neogobius melanostomus TaxID=47308 RepID=A0A8C6SMF2_9GOBI